MHLVFIGTGASTSKDRYQTSVYLASSTAKILFNTPKGIKEQLEKNNISLKTLDYIIINHKHSDAIDGIDELPETIPQIHDKVPNNLPFKLKIFEVKHAQDFKTYGYYLEIEGVTLLIIPDFKELPQSVLKLKPDIAILDASYWFGRRLINHASITETIEYLKLLKPAKTFLVQRGVTYPPINEAREVLKEYLKQQECRLDIELPEDGSRYSLERFKTVKNLVNRIKKIDPSFGNEKQLSFAKCEQNALLSIMSVEPSEEETDTRNKRAEQHWKANWFNYYPKKLQNLNFVYHHHWRGLVESDVFKGSVEVCPVEEDGVVIYFYSDSCLKLSKDSKIVFKFGDLSIDKKDFFERVITDKELLKTNHSLHGDLRLQSSKDVLHGWTIFLGKARENLEAGGDKLLYGDKPLQCAVKLEQPVAWVYVARNKPYIATPQSIGATARKFAIFYALDFGKYEPMTWHRHFFEYSFYGKKLKGRTFVASAPLSGNRKWLINRAQDTKYYAEVHTLEEIVPKLKAKGHEVLIWRKPKTKPQIVMVTSSSQ